MPEIRHLTLGEVLALAACNRLVLGLEERMQACKTARLETPPPLVLMDGLWLKGAGPGPLESSLWGTASTLSLP